MGALCGPSWLSSAPSWQLQSGPSSSESKAETRGDEKEVLESNSGKCFSLYLVSWVFYIQIWYKSTECWLRFVLRETSDHNKREKISELKTFQMAQLSPNTKIKSFSFPEAGDKKT